MKGERSAPLRSCESVRDFSSATAGSDADPYVFAPKTCGLAQFQIPARNKKVAGLSRKHIPDKKRPGLPAFSEL